MSDKDRPVIYCDTSVWIDLLLDEQQANPQTGNPRGQDALRLFQAYTDGRAVLATSGLVKAELFCAKSSGPAAHARSDDIGAWLDSPATRWVDIDRFLGDDAADLHASVHPSRHNSKKRMGGADAIHLAAAVRLRANYLFTQDQGFPIGEQVEGVEVCFPDLLWPPNLFDV